MYRDHGWQFLRLGQFIERAILVTALVDAHISVFPTRDRHWSRDWGSLLEVCAARSAFRRLQSIEYRPQEVMNFLVADKRLANSVSHALHEIEQAHAAVSEHRDSGSVRDAKLQIGKIRAQIEFDWPMRNKPDDTATRAMLAQITTACRQLNDTIEKAYFGYSISDDSVP